MATSTHCDCHERLAPDQAAHRQRLHERMAVDAMLDARECFHVGALPLHCELYRAATPQAPVVILLPGIGTYGELYAELLTRFAQAGYHAVVLDYPGHGFSSGNRGAYTVSGVVSGVSDLIAVLRQQFDGEIILFGYSIGSLLALACAEALPEVRALICTTLLLPEFPPDVLHFWGWQWIWSSSWFFPAYKLPLNQLVDFEQLLAHHPAAELLANDPLCVYEYPLSTLSSVFSWKSRSRWQQQGFDALILHGDRDEVLPFDYSRRIVERCRHRFELTALKGGHTLPWDHPRRLVDAADRWLQTTLARTAKTGTE